jgi:cell division protein FtsW
LQRDFDVIILISLVLGAMYFVSNTPIKMGLILVSIIGLIGLILFLSVPHINSRIIGYLNPESGGQTINYQVQQSQIAIGSGGIFGKGFGQSTQKFGNLPEPTNDSIFAVLGEEFGLFGISLLLAVYVLFAIYGYKISTNAQNTFGSLFTFGIITLILIQSLMNIASMVGIFPITGQPLVFVSHGGTSMLVTLAMMGIILNISRTSKE